MTFSYSVPPIVNELLFAILPDVYITRVGWFYRKLLLMLPFSVII